MTDRECCIACNCISGIGSATFSALLNTFGKASNIPGHSPKEYLEVKGIGQKLAEKLAATDFELACTKEVNRASARDVNIITLFDAEYPENLKGISAPPLALYVAGTLPKSFDMSLGIVGSRRISKYAAEQTRRIAFDAASHGCVIVSGMAVGADGNAHRAALDADGITVGVIGAGLENLYPAEHRDMAKEIIARNGALISELPMQFPVTATGFPRRNRIIAGLSRGVLVTEADVQSGSMITADYAFKYQRDVFALPGRVDNPNTSGCHKLIKEGAFLVEGFQDIAKKFGMNEPKITENNSASNLPELTDIEKIVFDGIRSGFDTFDMLVINTHLPTGNVTTALMMLEMKRLISRESDFTYRIKA